MTDSNTAITPFWRFSLNFYRQTGVSDACIALQDGCGVDVNLLLFLFWLASEGRQLSADDVKKLDDQVRSWRELTIIPIRDARRKLKGAATLVEPGKQEAFRNKVKAVELEAEQLQQEALYDFTKSGPLGAPGSPRGGGAGQCRGLRARDGRELSQRGRRPPQRRVRWDRRAERRPPTGTARRRRGTTPAKRKRAGMAKTAARLIVGISGASGTVYGVRILEMLRKAEIETHLVMSKSAEMTLVYETDLKPKDVRALASVHYPSSDIGAAISSGSFPTMGMIIAPCSIRTMSEIATGVTASLLSRAADVVLKEKRRLVLAVRETPLHGGHLRSMTTLADIGAVIAPIVPAFYNRPKSVDDIINHTCGRLLDLFGIDTGIVKRWKGGPAEE